MLHGSFNESSLNSKDGYFLGIWVLALKPYLLNECATLSVNIPIGYPSGKIAGLELGPSGIGKSSYQNPNQSPPAAWFLLKVLYGCVAQ